MDKPGFSVIIVSYNSGEFLPACIHSIFSSKTKYAYEVIVIDNGSQVPLTDDLKNQFPQVKWVDSKVNLGFGVGCNEAVKYSEFEHLFFVNPDTMVGSTTFEKMLDHYKELETPGVLGPKILNGDGSLQWACRRSFPSPMSAIYKTLGVSKLFPNSKKLAAYNMTYIDPEKEAEVDAVSGSFFCISEKLYQEVGGFDSDYFLYGEDLDIFFRIQQAGYKNYYTPKATVVHFKGMSFRTRRFRSYIDFYNAMLIFVNKHNERFRFFPKAVISSGVFFAALLGVFSRLIPQWWKMSTDLAIIAIVFISLIPLDNLIKILPWISGIAFAQVLPLIINNDYVSKGFRLTPNLHKFLPFSSAFGIIAWYLTKSPVLILAAILPSFLFYLWRKMMYWLGYFYHIFAGDHKRVVVIGAHKNSAIYFDTENIIPGYEFLGTLPFENAKIEEEDSIYLLAKDYSGLEEIRKRTRVKELLVVANEKGNYGKLPQWSHLNKLGLEMSLIIGNPNTETFVLVDLKNIV